MWTRPQCVWFPQGLSACEVCRMEARCKGRLIPSALPCLAEAMLFPWEGSSFVPLGDRFLDVGTMALTDPGSAFCPVGFCSATGLEKRDPSASECNCQAMVSHLGMLWFHADTEQDQRTVEVYSLWSRVFRVFSTQQIKFLICLMNIISWFPF